MGSIFKGAAPANNHFAFTLLPDNNFLTLKSRNQILVIIPLASSVGLSKQWHWRTKKQSIAGINEFE